MKKQKYFSNRKHSHHMNMHVDSSRNKALKKSSYSTKRKMKSVKNVDRLFQSHHFKQKHYSQNTSFYQSNQPLS